MEEPLRGGGEEVEVAAAPIAFDPDGEEHPRGEVDHPGGEALGDSVADRVDDVVELHWGSRPYQRRAGGGA